MLPQRFDKGCSSCCSVHVRAHPSLASPLITLIEHRITSTSYLYDSVQTERGDGGGVVGDGNKVKKLCELISDRNLLSFFILKKGD